MLNLQDQYGNSWFKIVNRQLVCDECKKGDRSRQLACTHMPRDESWLSTDKHDRLKALYAHAEGIALQELAGMIISEYVPCFNSDDIKRAFTEQGPVLTCSAPGIIFIGADPNNAGPSHLAVVSGYFDAAYNFVVTFFLSKKKYNFLNDLNTF